MRRQFTTRERRSAALLAGFAVAVITLVLGLGIVAELILLVVVAGAVAGGMAWWSRRT